MASRIHKKINLSTDKWEQLVSIHKKSVHKKNYILKIQVRTIVINLGCAVLNQLLVEKRFLHRYLSTDYEISLLV